MQKTRYNSYDPGSSPWNTYPSSPPSNDTENRSNKTASNEVDMEEVQDNQSMNQIIAHRNNYPIVTPIPPSQYNKIASAANSALVHIPAIDALSNEDLMIRFHIQIQLLNGTADPAQYGSFLREAEQILLKLKETSPLPLPNKIMQMDNEFQNAFQNSPNGRGALTQRDVDQLQHFTHIPNDVICTNALGDKFKKAPISIAELDSHFRSLNYSNIMHAREESNFEGIPGISDVFMVGNVRYPGYFRLSGEDLPEILENEKIKINQYFKENAQRLGYQSFSIILIDQFKDKEKAARLEEQGFQICTILTYPQVTQELENSSDPGKCVLNHSSVTVSNEAKMEDLPNNSSINQITIHQNNNNNPIVTPIPPSQYNKIASAANSALVHTPAIDALSNEDLMIRFHIQIQLLNGTADPAQYGSSLREAEQILLKLKEKSPLPLPNKIMQMDNEFQNAFQNSPNGLSALTQRDVDQLQHFTHIPNDVICTNALGDKFKKASISIAVLDSHFRSFGYSSIMHAREESNYEGIQGISDVFMVGKKRKSGHFPFARDIARILQKEQKKLDGYFKEKAKSLGFESFAIIPIDQFKDKEKAARFEEQGFQICIILTYPQIRQEGFLIEDEKSQNQSSIDQTAQLDNIVVHPVPSSHNHKSTLTAPSSPVPNVRYQPRKPAANSEVELKSLFSSLGYHKIEFIKEAKTTFHGKPEIKDIILLGKKRGSKYDPLLTDNLTYLKAEQIEITKNFQEKAQQLGYQDIRSVLVVKLNNKDRARKLAHEGWQICVYFIHPQVI